MARLNLAVLGAPEVRLGREVLAFATRKSLALLVYLLVEGGQHRRDRLTDVFWPESDGAAGRATLRSTLARLRDGLHRAENERHLIIERDTVGFDFASDFGLDLRALQSAANLAGSLAGMARPVGESRQTAIARLREGAAVWRGAFLEGFSLRDAPDFDDWAGLQREIWQRRMEVVLDRLSQLEADAGAGEAAIETVERWLRLNPLEERAHRRLMQVYAAGGDRAAARRAYGNCRAILEKELGVRPDPETEALAERYRASSSPTQRPDHAHVPRVAPGPGDGILVGRDDEFTALVERYHSAARGQTQAVLLLGEAGIGKTRLATAFLDWAGAQGADVLHGRAFEAGAGLSYQPLVDALRPRFERETALETLLSETWLAELSRLLPELRDRRPALPSLAADEAAARARLFEAVARAGLALAARAPLVVFIDDVQWADAASLDVLRYAGRRWTQDRAPVLLLCCLRSEALAGQPALAEWKGGLRRDLDVSDLDLGPLTYNDTVQLVRSWESAAAPIPGSESVARWVFETTHGQPLFVVETLRALHERGIPAGMGVGSEGDLLPTGVRRVIHDRLTPLSTDARDLLTAAGVIGQEAGFDLLCTVSALAEGDGLAALDTAIRYRLLREVGGREGNAGYGYYDFTHDRIRDVVYAEAGEARRRVFHRRALEALEEGDAPSAELARHAQGAGLDDAALRLSIAAGDAAMRLLAARDAAVHFERAIALAERLGRADLLADLHARRGHAFVSVALWAAARPELEAALSGVPDEEHDRRAGILTDLADACFWTMDIPALRRHAADILSLAGRTNRGDLEAIAIAWLATVEGSAGNLPASVEQNRRAINRARAAGVTPPPVAYFGSMALYWLGRPHDATPGIREAVAVAREGNDISWSMWSLPNLGLALAATGRYGEALQTFAEARRLGRESGAETQLARSIACSAGFRLELGDAVGAEALCHEARQLAHSLGFVPPAISAGIDLLMNYARRGDVGRAERLIDEVAAGVGHAGGFHGWLWGLRLAEARAEIALARGDGDDALHWANEAIAQSRTWGRVKYEVIGLTTRAEAQVALGRAKDAIADLRNAVSRARPVGDPALFLRAAADLLAIDGNDDLAGEVQAARDRISDGLPDEEMRRRFLAHCL